MWIVRDLFTFLSKKTRSTLPIKVLKGARQVGKTTPIDLTTPQLNLLNSLQINIVEKWIVSTTRSVDLKHAKALLIEEIFDHLHRLMHPSSER